MSALHWIAGLVVLCEALNKLERIPRSHYFARGVTWRVAFVTWLKGAAWLLLAAGAGGALVTPFLHLEEPTFQDVAVLAGFAILIVRSRFKEWAAP